MCMLRDNSKLIGSSPLGIECPVIVKEKALISLAANKNTAVPAFTRSRLLV